MANWQNSVLSEENIFSMCGLSEPVARCAGWMLIPRCRQESRKLADTNTAPWSMTIVSGTITGRAAACSSRSSMPSSRS